MSAVGTGLLPQSQYTMLATPCLLLSFAVPLWGFYDFFSCPKGKKCQKALLSGNDIILECKDKEAKWDYFFGKNQNDLADSTSSLNMEMTAEGDLHIKSPLSIHTGLYICLDKNGFRLAQYEIDFQDANLIYITHKDLRQEPLKNETLSLGHEKIIFTQWDPWQECGQCESVGERKRLGYCYVENPLEEPIPCGFFFKDMPFWSNRLRAEMQVEACNVPCKPESELQTRFVSYDSVNFNAESLQLTCPFGSIYRPILWEVNGVPVTWKNHLSGQQFNFFLDFATGGKNLQIFQPGTYRCFVDQEFIAQFHSQDMSSGQEPQSSHRFNSDQDGEDQVPLEQADSIFKGLKLLLLVCTVLGLVWLMFKSLRLARGKKTSDLLMK